jgi:hypothetical protein
MERGTGTVIIAVGLGLVVIGLLVRAGGLSWFGRLPGDLRLGSDGVRVFVPITSMIVVSVVLTIVINVIVRLWR